MTKIILTSKHSLNEVNFGKLSSKDEFLCEYKKAVTFYVDYLFNNKIVWCENRILDIKKDKLDCPSFISTTEIVYNSILSARALKSASTQACGIIKSTIKKRSKLLFVLLLKLKNKERTRSILKKLQKNPVRYPNLKNVKAELDTNCANFAGEIDTKYFDDIITLSSIGKQFGKIVIPFKHNSHSRELESKGKRLNGILLSKEFLYLRWEIELPELKKEGEIVGADQGIKTCVTLSDGQFTQKLQGDDLDTITNKLSRKKKGSKAFHKALAHRDNYIGWAIKQLNLKGIKEVRLEKVTNFRHGKCVSKKLNYFGEPLILKRMEKRLGLEGVLLTQESSAYKSQRCSNCSIVLKSNRKGKRYSCKRCFFQTDADLNSSSNQKANLPSLQLLIGCLDNRKGFFWKEEGIFSLNGEELTVPPLKKGK